MKFFPIVLFLFTLCCHWAQAQWPDHQAQWPDHGAQLSDSLAKKVDLIFSKWDKTNSPKLLYRPGKGREDHG